MSLDVCIYCGASGCLDNTVQHAVDCPLVTKLYPVTSYDLDGECCACGTPLASESFYTLVPEGRDGWDFVVCVSCAATGREVQR